MYVEIDEAFPDHRKTIKFCGFMQNSEAWSHLVRLWTWACRAAPDGDLTGMEPGEIELAMGWRPMDGRCYAAAVKARFIDESADGTKRIHNWEQRTGGSIKRMEAKANRKKLWRLHSEQRCGGPPCVFCVRGTPVGCQGDVQATSQGNDDVVEVTKVGDAATTQTRPDQARPDQTRPGKDLPERPPPARDPCTGLDLMRWYAAERSTAFPTTLSWQTPKTMDGKAYSFATGLSAEEVQDARPTMRLHFAELGAGGGKAGALENPTFGFGCWMADFTRLRERLHGRAPAAAARASPGRDVKVGYVRAETEHPKGEQQWRRRSGTT